MAWRISCFFIFGIIIFTNGNEYSHLKKNKNELPNLLQRLSNKRGKYDIQLNHHDDGPRNHHEDRAHIASYDEKHYNDENNHQSHSHHHHHGSHNHANNYPKLTNIQNLNIFSRKFLKNIARSGGNDDDEISRIMDTEADRMCKIKEKKEYCCTTTTPDPCESREATCTRMGDEKEDKNSDEVLQFLNDLDKYLENNGNYNVSMRCVGNGVGMCNDDDGKSRASSNNKGELHCSGSTCVTDIDGSSGNEKNDLHCSGKSCGRSRNDYDDDDVKPLDPALYRFLPKLNIQKKEIPRWLRMRI